MLELELMSKLDRDQNRSKVRLRLVKIEGVSKLSRLVKVG